MGVGTPKEVNKLRHARDVMQRFPDTSELAEACFKWIEEREMSKLVSN